jgi:8-oxo-dGTP pyrophosphatase MutT (NUDIX family)
LAVRRQAARAVVLGPDDRVLLIKARDPFNPAKGEWWELPGGGMEPGESSRSAAAREVAEETGLAGVEVGPCVWQHDARFTFAGLRFDQLEHIHVARWSGEAAAADRRELEYLEALAFSGTEWWSLDDLIAMVAAGGRVIPPWLPVQLPLYLAEGAPELPLHLGDLESIF